MELTSVGFVVTLFMAAALIVAAVVWLWPRFAGRGLRALAARLGVIALIQIALTMAILAMVNSYFEFYSGWDDLFGTNTKPGTLQHVASAAAPRKPIVARTSLTEIGGHGGKATPARDGAIEELKFQGQTTGLPGDVYMILPPEYYTQPTRRFPVSVVITGYPGNPGAMIHAMHFPQLIRQGAAEGKIQPTIYVLTRPTLVPPRDTECTDVPGGPQVETFFAADLPAAISARFRTGAGRSSWGIMGDSTGGYCAAKIAMRHSEQYSAAVSVSGYFRSLRDLTTGDLWGGSRSLRDENDLFWRQQHRPAPPIALLVTSCKKGEKTYPEAMRFLAGVQAPMTADTFILDSGGHNFRTFGRMMPTALAWMSSHLSVPRGQ
jgi:hypothetical protein